MLIKIESSLIPAPGRGLWADGETFLLMREFRESVIGEFALKLVPEAGLFICLASLSKRFGSITNGREPRGFSLETDIWRVSWSKRSHSLEYLGLNSGEFMHFWPERPP